MAYFVVRDTNHPEEDLQRNWSAFAGGSSQGEDGGSSQVEAKKNYANHIGIEVEDVTNDFKYHPAYQEFVMVDYEGLGAFALESETLEEALKEANECEDGLAICTESGDGHFYAEDCIAFHKVRDGRYIFEIK